MKLSYDDVKRYIAHINLKKIGSFGQKKIIDTKVLIIGVGGCDRVQDLRQRGLQVR